MSLLSQEARRKRLAGLHCYWPLAEASHGAAHLYDMAILKQVAASRVRGPQSAPQRDHGPVVQPQLAPTLDLEDAI